jgi:DNA-binding response OmpR family regulator
MRVLYADDNPEARTLLAAVLQELGHEAIGAEDGAGAWDAYRADPVPLVIVDLKMPGIDGFELCRLIREHDRERATFILVITAHDEPGAHQRVHDCVADDNESKPSSPKNLRARIEIADRRMRQAAALRSAEADLARARWMAGIGETALAMEREINGPLRTILEKSARLLADRRFDDDQRDQLRIIGEQGARLAGVIGRAVNLESPQSVEYLAGARMIDLSGDPR